MGCRNASRACISETETSMQGPTRHATDEKEALSQDLSWRNIYMMNLVCP